MHYFYGFPEGLTTTKVSISVTSSDKDGGRHNNNNYYYIWIHAIGYMTELRF